VYPAVFGLRTFAEPADYSNETKPSFERQVGAYATPVSAEAAKDIPDAYQDSKGSWVYDTPVFRNDFQMNSESMKAYKNIQDIARQHLADTNGKPREMDHEVAVIRAKLQSGEFTKEQAKEVAWNLRKRRDIERAERVAQNLTAEMAREGRWKPGDRGVTWQDVYVPTTKEMLSRYRAGGRKAVVEEINDVVTNRALRDAEDMVQRDRMLNRAAYLADRFGLSPETVDEQYDDNVRLVYNPDDPDAMRSSVQSALADYEELEAGERKTGMRRYPGDRGYPQYLTDLLNYINYAGNEGFRSRWAGPAPTAEYKIRRKRRVRTGRYL
jgi:hypothetical protein